MKNGNYNDSATAESCCSAFFIWTNTLNTGGTPGIFGGGAAGTSSIMLRPKPSPDSTLLPTGFEIKELFAPVYIGAIYYGPFFSFTPYY